MKITACAKLGIRFAAFYFILAGFSHTVYAQSEVHFRLAHETVIIVSLTANRQGPFNFVLDTGTDSSVLDPIIARQLALAPLGRIELNTVAGTQTVIRSAVQTLVLGTARVENVEVLVQDLSELRKVDSHIQGIVGQNFLSHFNYLLDYRKRVISVESDHEIRDNLDGERVPVEVSENKIVVASEAQSSGSARLRLLLDSGANLVVLTQRTPAAGVNKSASENWMQVTSAGQGGMRVGHLKMLVVGTQQLRDIAVALPAPQPADAERIEDGLLPAALFKTLYINNLEGFIEFNPKPKKN